MITRRHGGLCGISSWLLAGVLAWLSVACVGQVNDAVDETGTISEGSILPVPPPSEEDRTGVTAGPQPETADRPDTVVAARGNPDEDAPAAENPCKGVTCSDHGACEVVEGKAQCRCGTGFHAEGLTCVHDAAPPPAPNPFDAAAILCVEEINRYRASIQILPLARWADAEECSNQEALRDASLSMAHASFKRCGEWSQNECPGWGGWRGDPIKVIRDCLKAMWAEGTWGGHYRNMASTRSKKISCGFYRDAQGRVTAVQNFR